MANNTFQTRIVLRHDTAENWASINPVLLAYEMGIESGANGKHKIKFGDGVNAWNDLPYTYNFDAIAQLIAENAAGTIYQINKSDLEASDDASLATVSAPRKGDVAVIKTVIDTTEYERSAYMHDGSTWIALNGAVDADKVIMRENIVLAGNFTQVGNWTKGLTATVEKEVKGKSVNYVLNEILSKDEPAAISTQPSTSITLSNAKAYEVGTSFTPSYSVGFNKGSYKFGPADTGVAVTGYAVTDTNGGSATTQTGTFDAFTVGDSTNYKVSVTTSYGDGVTALTGKGNASDVKITADTKSASSSAVTGYRAWFQYVGTETTAIDGDWIRNKCTNKGAWNSNSLNITVSAGTKRVVVAAIGKTLSKCIDVDGMGLDIKDKWTKSTVAVSGANSYAAKEYNVWVFENANGVTATTFQITMA